MKVSPALTRGCLNMIILNYPVVSIIIDNPLNHSDLLIIFYLINLNII